MRRYGFSFLAFVLIWTWGFWSIPVLLSGNPWQMPYLAFFLIGGAGPAIGGLAFTYAVRGKDGLRDLWQRLTDVRRIRGVWWLAVLGIVPAVEAMAFVVSAAVSDAYAADLFVPLACNLQAPVSFLAMAGFVFLLGPLPEEIGWRGFGLDALQAKFSPFAASLILASAWAAWHAPLFLMDGYYERFGTVPDPFWFVYDIYLTTLLITWIYNRTGRSVLAAVLFHFMVNFSEELVAGSPAGDLAASGLNTLLVLAVLWRGGFRQRT